MNLVYLKRAQLKGWACRIMPRKIIDRNLYFKVAFSGSLIKYFKEEEHMIIINKETVKLVDIIDELISISGREAVEKIYNFNSVNLKDGIICTVNNKVISDVNFELTSSEDVRFLHLSIGG